MGLAERNTVKKLWSAMSETFSAWNDDEAPRLAAALSFYTILSLAPLVILVIAIVSLAFGHSAAQGQLISQIRALVGEEGAKAVQTVIANSKAPASGGLASVIGVITLLVGASGVCGELQSALNKIWEVPAKIGLIRARFFSFAMVLGVGFLLLVSLVISAALAALGKFFGGVLPMPEFVPGNA